MGHKELSTYEETVTNIVNKAIVEYSCDQCNKRETKDVGKSWSYSNSHPENWQRTIVASKYSLLCNECYAKRVEMMMSEPYRSLDDVLDSILDEFYYSNDYDSGYHEIPDSFSSMETVFNNIARYVDDYREKINGK